MRRLFLSARNSKKREALSSFEGSEKSFKLSFEDGINKPAIVLYLVAVGSTWKISAEERSGLILLWILNQIDFFAWIEKVKLFTGKLLQVFGSRI
jgi:hypothetical protein